MITRATHMTIFVNNQDEALSFYTEKLGFDLHTDVNMQGFRWVTVCPKNQRDFELALMPATTPEQQVLVGKQADQVPLFCVGTDNCQQTFEELKNRGVTFMTEPQEKPWGTEALCKDLYGNIIDIVQSPKKED